MLQKTLLSSFDTPVPRHMTTWTKQHHSRKSSKPRSNHGTSKQPTASLCTKSMGNFLDPRQNHRGLDISTQSLFRAAGSSRRFRSSQAAKVTLVQLDVEETMSKQQSKGATMPSHGSIFQRNIIETGHPPTICASKAIYQRWRQFRYSTTQDFEKMLMDLSQRGYELTPLQQFKILRSALYQIPEQNCQMTWKVYQQLIERGLDSFMESNNYSRLLNNLKYGKSSDTVQRMLSVLDRMDKADPTMPCSYHYSQILFALSRHGQVQKVRDLMIDMHDKHLALSSSHYTSLGVACLNAQPDSFSIDDIIADFSHAATVDRIIPERQACNIIVELLCRRCELPRAIKFLQSMEDAAVDAGRLSPDARMYTEPDVYTYTSLIAGFCRMGDLKAAKRVLDDMTQAKVSHNIVTYAIMANAYLQHRKTKEALSYIEHMRLVESTAKHPVYMALMVKALALDMRNIAEDLYKALNVEISGNWNSLDNMQRSAYVLMKLANGNTRGVQRRFRHYIQHQPELINSVMINHLIRSLGMKGDIKGVEEAFSWFDSTSGSRHRLERTRYTYHHYVQALFNCQQTEKAFDAVTDMKTRGFSVDALTYAIIIKGLVANRELETAWKMFEMMKQDRTNQVEQNEKTAFARDSPFLRAISSIMSGLVDSDLGKQSESMNEHTRDANLLADTFAELRDMDSMPITPQAKDTHNKAQPGIQRAFAMLRDLQSSKITRANVYTYSIIIAGFAKHDIRRAMQVFQHMLADGIQPNDVVYTALIQGFAIARDAKGALALFEDMRQRDIEPNQFTWHYLLRAMLRSGVDKEYVDQVGHASRNGLPYKPRKHRTKKWELLAYVN
jgi:pentatricopeptide repeat protein